MGDRVARIQRTPPRRRDWLVHDILGFPTQESPTKPITLKAYDQIRDNITEAAKHARSLFLVHISINAYAILVVATLDDSAFFGSGAQIKLPLVDVVVSTRAFFIGMPAISLLVMLYLQLYLERAWALVRLARGLAFQVSRDPEFVPATSDFRYPWIAFFSETPGPGNLFARLAFSLVSWGAVPALFALCWGRLVHLNSTITLWGLDGAPSAAPFAIGFVTLLIAFGAWAYVRGRRLGWGRPWSAFLRPQLVALCSALAVYTLVESRKAHRIQLTNAELSYRPLPGSGKLPRGASLQAASWENAQLAGAYLVSANLTGAQLNGANLREASLERAQLQGASLNRATLTGARLSNAVLQGASFLGANLQGAELVWAWMIAAKLEGASVAFAKLAHARLQNADLRGADLMGANLREASLQGAQLRDAFLHRATLVSANLENARLHSVDAESADFRGAYFDGTDLSSAVLTAADLREANLSSVNLRRAFLINARLERANLTSVDLTGANLSDARLEHATFIDVKLYGVMFSEVEVRNLVMKDCRCDYHSILPTNYVCESGRVAPNQLSAARATGQQ